MKEYFQKVIAWAKANPWLAAGILGGILLLVYLAVKNGWLGGGGGGDGASALGPDDDGGEALLPDLTDLPDTSTLMPGVGDIGQSSEPIPVELPSVQPSNFGGLSEEAPAYDPGYIDNSTFYSGAPAISPASYSLAEVSSPAPLAAIGAGFFSGNLDYGSTARELPAGIVSAVPVAKSENKKSSGSKSGNPAQQKGKGKNFTGYIDGVYYSKGYPAAPSSLAVQTTLKPSPGSIVSPAQGGGFFTGSYLDPTVKKKSKPKKSKKNKR